MGKVLEIEKASVKYNLVNGYEKQIRTSYGIGTYLTNDVGVKPLNIVIKLSDVLINNEWVPAIKLSDDKGKHTGDKNMVELAKKVLSLD